MIDKEFVPYEQALALKELGFDEPCFSRYCIKTVFEEPTGEILLQNTDCKIYENRFLTKAPLYRQAFRWFLDNYGLFVETTLWGDGIGYMSQIKQIKKEEFLEVYNLGYVSPNRGLPNWDREKEELECLKKLIELCKK